MCGEWEWLSALHSSYSQRGIPGRKGRSLVHLSFSGQAGRGSIGSVVGLPLCHRHRRELDSFGFILPPASLPPLIFSKSSTLMLELSVGLNSVHLVSVASTFLMMPSPSPCLGLCPHLVALLEGLRLGFMLGLELASGLGVTGLEVEG